MWLSLHLIRAQVGVGQVIRGWDIGILGADDIPPLRPGGKRELVIPADLAYGSRLDARPLQLCVCAEEGGGARGGPGHKQWPASRRGLHEEEGEGGGCMRGLLPARKQTNLRPPTQHVRAGVLAGSFHLAPRWRSLWSCWAGGDPRCLCPGPLNGLCISFFQFA